MAGATRVTGLDEVLAGLNRASAQVKEEVKTTLEDFADRIENRAQQLAPSNRILQEFPIAQNIGKYPENKGITWRIEIGSQALPMAAYFEFGTGKNYNEYKSELPPEWQELALTFKKNGKGTIKRSPFLYPAFFEFTPQLITQLRLDLNNISI